jgi:hypothetical protein
VDRLQPRLTKHISKSTISFYKHLNESRLPKNEMPLTSSLTLYLQRKYAYEYDDMIKVTQERVRRKKLKEAEEKSKQSSEASARRYLAL